MAALFVIEMVLCALLLLCVFSAMNAHEVLNGKFFSERTKAIARNQRLFFICMSVLITIAAVGLLVIVFLI